jgi:TRAP-type C4-dicarboxylate transport system permease small subunit
MTKLNKIYDRILDITVILAGALLIFQMVSVCLEVVLRYFFNRPTTWVVEIAAYIVLWIPYLGAAWILRNDGHVRMDLLLGFVSPKIRLILNIFTSFIAAFICVILTWYGVKVVIDLYQTNFLTQTYLMLHKWPIIAVIPLSTFLLLIEFLRKIGRLLNS